MSIVRFLRARLAEDERSPRADIRDVVGVSPWDAVTLVGGRFYDDFGHDITDAFLRWQEDQPLSEEAVRWCDEVEAKRYILEARLAFVGYEDGEEDCGWLDDDPVLCALAYPYRNHPDHNPEWRFR